MKPFPILVVAIIVIMVVPLSSAESDEGTVRLSGIHPTSSFEGVEITNYGRDIDLRQYSISDGEGTVSFQNSVVLKKGESIWILKSEPAEWFRCDRYAVMGTSGILSSKFAMNDSGDDIYLLKNGVVIDSFVYGNVSIECKGWEGEPFDRVSKNSFAIRTSFFDTDTKSDWILKIPGRTDESETDIEYNASVSALTFPESKGYPIFSELSKAQVEVDISVYIISHNDIVAILIDLLEKGVNVNILCDCNPVGGMPDAELKALQTLVSKGADVHLIKSDDDGFRRYTYLHNKYAVIDCKTVVITSENWIESSFDSNRGWGVIVRSEEYAGFMNSIFISDFDIANTDIVSFADCYKETKTYVYISDVVLDQEYDFFSAVISPVVSPDNSYESMRLFIDTAEYRIYCEQLDVQYGWLYSDDNPLQWMISKGSVGIDCRLMVDTTFDSPDDENPEDSYGLIESLSTNEYITCKSVVGNYSVVHNKGVIVDDSVWVGSVNWTYNSFINNRESAVIIRSQEIADFFAEYYLKDWGLDEGHIVPVITIKGEMKEGSTIIIDASDSKVNPDSTFLWDLDNDGVYESKGQSVLVKATSGKHIVTLMITDFTGNVRTIEKEYEISQNEAEPVMKYIPLIILCAMILLINAIKKIRGRCR